MRNTELNATGFFKPLLNQKPALIQNQYGGSLGGAIKRDKIFFFADFEGFRRVEKALTFAAVPSLNLRNGIFSGPIQNPYTGVPYPNNIVPASDITKFARDILADLPVPNIATTVNGANNLQTLPKQPTEIDKGDGRYDHYFGSRLTVFGRYSHRVSNIIVPASIPGPSGGNSNGNIYVKNWQVAGGATYTLSPRSVVEFRMGISHSINSKLPWFVGTTSLGERFNLPNAPRDPRYTGGVNGQSISGFTGLGVQGSNPQFQNPTVINPKVNYSLLLGKHSIKAGYEYQLINTEIDDFNPKYGGDTYNGRFSKVPGTPNDNEQFLADFLFGARSNYTLNNAAIVNYRQRMHFLYVADDWKVNRALTVNAGLRYEYATPQYLDNNKLSNFDPATNSLIAAKDGSIADRSLVNPDRNNFATAAWPGLYGQPEDGHPLCLRRQLHPLQPYGW